MIFIIIVLLYSVGIIACLRKHKQWELAYDLCSKYAVICIENLSLKGMQKLWGRKVSELRFGEFVKKLEYVASKVGTLIVKVGKWFASSQLCSTCGYKYENVKDLHLRKWTCPHCGQEHDRDVNVAKNILTKGLSILQTKGYDFNGERVFSSLLLEKM